MSGTHIYTGIVTQGSRKASALGFPTINIPLVDGSLSGIYAGRVALKGKTYVAAVYADQRRKILEAHLVDFPGDMIAGVVTIELVTKVREDRMFDDDEALKMAIMDDIEQVRALTME
jgi:riboflavin kinase/FMN adenylyltransferase